MGWKRSFSKAQQCGSSSEEGGLEEDCRARGSGCLTGRAVSVAGDTAWGTEGTGRCVGPGSAPHSRASSRSGQLHTLLSASVSSSAN